MVLRIGGCDLQVFTYRAKDYAAKQGPLIWCFTARPETREIIDDDDARWPTVRRAGRAPRFDERQFPETLSARQRPLAGPALAQGEMGLQPGAPLIDAIRAMEGRGDMPYYLIGHRPAASSSSGCWFSAT